MRNCESIMHGLAKIREENKSLRPDGWLTYAEDLNLFLAVEHDKLAEMEQDVAKLKLLELEKQDKRSVAAAETIVDATDAKKVLRKQRFFVDRVEQQILLAKKRAGMDL